MEETDQPRDQPERIEIVGGTFEPAGHFYRDAQGHRVLSVTQVFQSLGLVDYSGVDPEVLHHKSEIGIAVHKAIELLLTNVLDWDTVDDAAMTYVVGTELWFKNMLFDLTATEQQGIHCIYGMPYGFQYDQLGSILYQGVRRRVVIDLKTAVQKSATWSLQTAAYALAAPKLPDGEHYLRVVLHLQKDGRVKPLYYDDPEDEKTFLYMLYCAQWKQNHDYALAA